MKNKGYTLIELAIVFTIGGVMMASTGSMLLIYTKQAKVSETTTRLDRINIALKEYVRSNGKYPCPASQEADVEATTFGYEASEDCTGTLAGTIIPANQGRNNKDIRIGTLPVRSMGLPDEDMFDGWGNRLLYAVTLDLAKSPDDFIQDQGAIYIRDAADNPAQLPNGSAHYVVISFGQDGMGAYGLHGQKFRACGTAMTQTENCDNNNAIFRTQLKSAGNSSASTYDDYIIYGAQYDTAITSSVFPSGAVVAFDQANCPSDPTGPNNWSTVDPEDPSGWSQAIMAGRVPVGAGDFSESFSDTGTRKGWSNHFPYPVGDVGGVADYIMNASEMPAHAHKYLYQVSHILPGTDNVFSYGTNPSATHSTSAKGGGQKYENRQPYIALTYCIKD